MTAPTDFESFAGGFDLLASNYSGGAGGTFSNLKSGGPAWTVNGATPSFSTKTGTGWSREGMDFTALSTQPILGKMPALWECTVVSIAQPATTASLPVLGGTYSGGNSWGQFVINWHAMAFNGGASSPQSTAATTGRPHVWSVSFCPENGTMYAQADSATVTTAVQTGEAARINWGYVGIGQHRTTYFNGWISRVLIFSRALHYRDPTGLANLITTERSLIGL